MGVCRWARQLRGLLVSQPASEHGVGVLSLFFFFFFSSLWLASLRLSCIEIVMHSTANQYLLLFALWSAMTFLCTAAAAVPSVTVNSDDLVVMDGSLITVRWTGFDVSSSPALMLTLYDTENSTRYQRWTASTTMGYSIMRVNNMAVTSSADISVCAQSTRRPNCAYLSTYFSILYAP